MRVVNNNVLVKLVGQTTKLGNGLSVNTENQNRKDIVTGTVYLSNNNENLGAKVWFPLYAASLITLPEGEFYIVSWDDIVLIDGND